MARVACGGRQSASNMLDAAFTDPRDTDNDGQFDHAKTTHTGCALYAPGDDEHL